MASEHIPVIDCDGHLIESAQELLEFMEPVDRESTLSSDRRWGIFPSLDGFHYPRGPRIGEAPKREYVQASEHRRGSGEDWLAFLEKAEVEQSVIFPTQGLSVGFIQMPSYAVRMCRTYNDWVFHRYRQLSDRIHPIALIPMQDVSAAVVELRRAVKELGLPGATLPSTGPPLHLGHEQYWPVYKEASDLGCVLGVHGGSNKGLGMDTFTNFMPSHLLHHPVPLMIAMVSLVYHGVLDRFPGLRICFLEGGAAWIALLLDQAARDEAFFGVSDAKYPLHHYLTNGQLLVGCEGEDPSLPYVASRAGIEAFAYSSDYPHEVDLQGPSMRSKRPWSTRSFHKSRNWRCWEATLVASSGCSGRTS